MNATTEVVAANLILDDQGCVLLVRESKSSSLGRWSLPAGRVERGESLREAARREAHEETGLHVEVGELLGIHHAAHTLEGGSAVVFVFRSSAVAGEITTSDEHPAVEYVPRDRLDRMIEDRSVRGQHIAPTLRAHDEGVALPDDVVTEVPASLPPRA